MVVRESKPRSGGHRSPTEDGSRPLKFGSVDEYQSTGTPRSLDRHESQREGFSITNAQRFEGVMIEGVGDTGRTVYEPFDEGPRRLAVQHRRNERTLTHAPLRDADHLALLQKDLARSATGKTDHTEGAVYLQRTIMDNEFTVDKLAECLTPSFTGVPRCLTQVNRPPGIIGGDPPIDPKVFRL